MFTFFKSSTYQLDMKNYCVYLELVGANNIAYRVLSGNSFYGVEAEDYENGFKEQIYDFSQNLEDAVNFVEMLISLKKSPRHIYSLALNFLSVSI